MRPPKASPSLITSASPGSPLIKNLTVAILQLSESGELKYLQDKWWASSCVGDSKSHASGALHTHELQGLFLLLGLGLGVGLLLALLELVSRAHSEAKDGKVGSTVSIRHYFMAILQIRVAQPDNSAIIIIFLYCLNQSMDLTRSMLCLLDYMK